MSVVHAVASERDSAPEYFSLPQEYYVSEEWYRRDLEVVLRPKWLFAGHTSTIPNAGDYFLFHLGDDSFIIIRQDDGSTRALANTCRHRGSPICLDQTGQGKKRLTCPYHAWSYGLNGDLRVAPRMQSNLDKSQYGLKQAAVEVWNGMIFVCAGVADPVPLAERMRDMDLSPWKLEDSRVAADETFDIPVNWKLVTENFWECYHCSIAHPELCAVYDPNASAPEVEEPDPAADLSDYVRSAADTLRPGVRSYTLTGERAVARPLGDAQQLPPEHDSLMFAFPNFNTVAIQDYFLTFSWLPRGPQLTQFRATWSVHKDAVEGRDYDLENLKALFRVTALEDIALATMSRAGVNSSTYEPGPYNRGLEAAVISWMRVYHHLHETHGG
ncbi:aromatic ring-hydroxylating dioxygenase subunit alpha [Mycobacterium sp. CBMA293]|uniref:aromatic ring-hydroxylating oxygenase subunit alpha n=1 Tax=unclassified Mycolicibacterium TaxID=2636767 RepID=UPI0012DDC088|nr:MULTISPECIES: aromatic ring-hydroxylating dioxygenase subunit alpha [unclassified Mycolicibacterium]MUL49411.1 aromatic ring-hydroxylating dioxygenase subunit alpha [Mycolicibacterium sp. CBMA 360]MUL62587.1 aromatic ring-hydroxylating dioxygenase subunit alpha [Mycolicibacterium sp. CBMA 335]MUL69039.1 aromatic ring-hydroxylating dioxygenase subunit alpha [Mycolicibacterium sp. CBMA 311]MUL96978.1 aromatic ring-hydroxylating dioxygenase subunit alpha [Mycolicibacterium sp. CBMA 230]MUM1341